MHTSLSLALILIVCPSGIALDVPDEGAMMQVQLKSAQGRSGVTAMKDSKMWEHSYYDAKRNGTNATRDNCLVGFSAKDVAAREGLTYLEMATAATGSGSDASFQGIIYITDTTIVQIDVGETGECNCELNKAVMLVYDISFCETDGTTVDDLNFTAVNPPTDFVPWNLDRIDARRGYDNSYSVNEGLMASIYVVDSGILNSHIDSGGRAIPGIETESGNLILCAPTNKTCSKDAWGHGSHLAGISIGNSAGVSKLSRTFSVRISGLDKGTTMSAWLRGYSWIAKYASKPATIASIWASFGKSVALIRVFNTVINSGIITSAAAGNKVTSACEREPHSYGLALSVAGTDRWDRRAWWSAFGMCISLFTPGESISAWGHTYDESFIDCSGTSMATPHGAAASAVVVGRAPTLTPADLHMILVGDSTKGILTNIGAGSPNIFLYLATDTGKCFPGEATVQVEHFGHMPLMNLQLGDKVRVKSATGDVSYEPVLGFLHQVHGKVDRPSEFLSVTHTHGQFRATAGHLVFTSAGERPMSSLQVGDQIVVEGIEKLSKIIAVHQTVSVSGMYAPFTASGTIVVDEAVASNYATPSNGLWLPHTAAHAFFYPMRLFSQLRVPTALADKTDAMQPFLMMSHQFLRLDKAFVRWASY